MITTIEQFKKDWTAESAFTQGLMNALTDESLGQSVADDHRSLGRIAWHVVLTIPEMMGRTGLTIKDVAEDAPLPGSAEEIKKAYEAVSTKLSEQILSGWTDATLQESDDMYGEQWQRGATLAILIRHEVHHRGQMSVLMRQAGLNFPDIYGPTLEGWAAYGSKPPAV